MHVILSAVVHKFANHHRIVTCFKFYNIWPCQDGVKLVRQTVVRQVDNKSTRWTLSIRRGSLVHSLGDAVVRVAAAGGTAAVVGVDAEWSDGRRRLS